MAVDADRLLERSREAGIAYTLGDVFHLDGSGEEHLSLSYARLDEAAIDEGVAELGRLARESARGRER